jgi:chitinase
MPSSRKYFLILILALFAAFPNTRAALWCTGYFPGYNDGNSMAPTDIDFSVVTHVVHFSVIPQSDGSLDYIDNGITNGASAAIISAAHAAGRQCLICVGGAGSDYFSSAASSGNVAVFVNNLINFMVTRGYDGIDIDWEPWSDSYAPLYTNLVVQLRASLDAINTNLLLTTSLTLPTPWDSTTLPQTLASVSGALNQINLQTYDLSGPYPGWITWHNSSIYDNGVTLPGGLPAPSLNAAVLRFITNGVPAAKVGLGVTFHGQLWTGEAVPAEPLTQNPTMTPITYNAIVEGFSSAPYFWDSGAQAPYISITNSNPNSAVFISYDDARACEGKVSYARNLGLGGMIIWELKQDHNAGQPDPLLTALKNALATPGQLSASGATATSVTLSFTAAPLGSYRLQWSSSLVNPVWNSVALTNITSAGGVIQMTDTFSASATPRYYRLKTPQ